MLTVLIPSYNHALYIEECLSRVVNINIPGISVLVIDDGSTDNSIEIIEEFIARNSERNIRFIKKPNGGLVSSLNQGLELIHTDYFYVCASDDLPDPEGIETCFCILQKNPHYDFVFGSASALFGSGETKKIYGKNHAEFFSCNPQGRNSRLFLNYPSPLLLQSALFKTDFVVRLGGWDGDIALDDYQLFIKIFKLDLFLNKNFVFLSNTEVVRYRQHDNNTYKNTLGLFRMVRQTLTRFAPEIYREKSIAKYAASYILSSVRLRRFKDAFEIFGDVSWASRIRLPWYLFGEIYSKLIRSKD